jgi:hypothetical protein
VFGFAVGRVDGDLCRGEFEDQPAVTRIDPGKAERVADERPVCCLWVPESRSRHA